jgi:hypothetical protein
MINPYHLNPGILLDVEITSIKRKKATLDAMANVLNEFLSGVSKGFSDAAFASFSRRRSTVREDLAQSFSAPTEEEGKPVSAPKGEGPSYLDLINDESPASVSSPAPARAIAAPKRGRGASKPRAAAGGAKSRGRPKAGAGDAGLKEV